MQPYWVSANAVTTHGLPVAFTWKAWVHTGDDDPVWWQLDPIFKSLDLCQGKELMADWLRKRLPAYDVDWEAANLTRELAYQPSRKSQEAKAKSAGTAVAGPPCQHASHTMSTPGLLVFLRKCTVFLRGESKVRAAAVLNGWMQLLLPATCAEGAGPAQHPHAQRCDLDPQDGICCHLRQCTSQSRLKPTPQEQCCELSYQLYSASPACEAAKAYDAALVETFAGQMNASLPSFACTSDPVVGAKLNVELGPQARPYSIDEDYKRTIVEDTLKCKRARTGGQAMQADRLADPPTANKWNESAIVLQQSSAFIQFKATQTLSIVGDASRIGNPAENCEVMAVWSPEVNAAVWLPPQARPC